MIIPTCNYTYLNNEFYVKSIKNNNYIPYVFGFIISISSIGLLISIYNINLEYKQKIQNKIKKVLYIILILIFLGLLGYSGYELGTYSTYKLSTTYTTNELLRPCFSKYEKKIFGLSNPSSSQILPTQINTSQANINKSSQNKINTIESTINNIPSLEGGLQMYSYDDTLSNSVKSDQLNPSESQEKIKITPFNTRTSKSTSTTDTNATPGSGTVESSANSNSNLGNKINISMNETPRISTINTTNEQKVAHVLPDSKTGFYENRILGDVKDGDSIVAHGQRT